ncbi:MAG TPA: CBS domain-containing protein [Ignavibacteriales bacterium]|nr:CBS domain-containing protein [Ignavibacteriales bacterium]
MKTVLDILKSKGNTVWSIAPGAPVFDALSLMAEKEIGALPVIENGNLLGIISERDYARKVILQGKFSRETTVKEIMSQAVIYVTPSYTVEECMALMTNKRIRHLPVYDSETLQGIISIGDVVKAEIEEKEFVIDQLMHYIKDTPAIETDK